MKNRIKTQHEKAQGYFVLIVIINLSILAVMTTGIVIGVKGYISDTRSTYETVSCCGSVCTKCLFTLCTLFTVLPWVCVATLSVGVCKAVRRIFSMVYWNGHFISTGMAQSIHDHPEFKNILHDERLGKQTIFIINNPLCCAFTAGLIDPHIYLSTAVCARLTAKELLAVILHELHHKINRIPLRLFILKILCELNYFLPINRSLLNLYTSASEMAADDNVVNLSGEPVELASALVKLSQPITAEKLFASASFFGKQCETENRIKRLLLPHEKLSTPGTFYFNMVSLSTLFVSTALCFPLFYQHQILPDTTECMAHSCHTTVCK
jgi:beta-lactamase regulating signal transducer with metallopeptidase domain